MSKVITTTTTTTVVVEQEQGPNSKQLKDSSVCNHKKPQYRQTNNTGNSDNRKNDTGAKPYRQQQFSHLPSSGQPQFRPHQNNPGGSNFRKNDTQDHGNRQQQHSHGPNHGKPQHKTQNNPGNSNFRRNDIGDQTNRQQQFSGGPSHGQPPARTQNKVGTSNFRKHDKGPIFNSFSLKNGEIRQKHINVATCIEEQQHRPPNNSGHTHFKKNDTGHQVKYQGKPQQHISGPSKEKPQSGRNETMKRQDQECPICSYTLLKGALLDTPCHHQFHFKCLHEWLKLNKHCPLCRRSVSLFDIE